MSYYTLLRPVGRSRCTRQRALNAKEQSLNLRWSSSRLEIQQSKYNRWEAAPRFELLLGRFPNLFQNLPWREDWNPHVGTQLQKIRVATGYAFGLQLQSTFEKLIVLWV